MLHEPESNILCFRYLGDGRFAPERLDELNLRLREAFLEGYEQFLAFDRGTLDVLTDLAWQGIRGLVEIQKDVAGV